MAEYRDYKSSKKKSTTNKRKVGTYPTVNVKSSEYLPEVFQTRINQAWLDSTLDQLVSKGALEDIDHYVGDKSGKYRTEAEQTGYLNTKNNNIQLAPSIVSDTRITYDDVSQALEQYFDDYNYNAAYTTQSYVYRPPICPDKFLNFSSYYWVPNLPVYESDNTNGTGTYTTDPITDINGKVTHTFVDDNNSFDLEDGMRIKLELGYDASIAGNIYIVTGVGKEINLRLYTEMRKVVPSDTSPTALKRPYPIWTDENQYTNATRGYWDNLDVIDITYTKGGVPDGRGTDPQAIKTTYNSTYGQAGTAPALYFYADNNRKVYMADGMVVKLGTSWPNVDPLDIHRIFWVTVSSGGVSFDPIIDASYDSNGDIKQEIVTTNRTTSQIAKAQSYTPHTWDSNNNWDTFYTPTALKDYMVINRDDPIATAYSRSNHWIHRDTIFKLAEMNSLMDASTFTTIDNQARRPIIEFEGGIHIIEHGNDDGTQTWAGPVDFIINNPSVLPNIQDGNTYIVGNTNLIKMRDRVNGDSTYKTLNPGDTFIVRNAIGANNTNTNFLTNTYVRQDLWTDSGEFTKIGYVKKRVNQPPLYYLYDDERQNTRLDDTTKYPDSTFTYAVAGNGQETGGCKLFAYKEGTGTTIDPELDMVVSMKDIGHKAEYEFVNHQDKDKFTYSLITSDGGLVDTDTIMGYYSYKQHGLVKNAYVPANVQRGAKEKIQQVVTDATQAQTIPIGYDSWRSAREFVVHTYGNNADFTVTENISSGIQNERKETRPTLTVRAGETYTFINISHVALNFYSDFAGTAHTTGVTTSGNTSTVVMPSSAGTLYYGDTPTTKAKIIILENDDYLYHDLFIDGERIRQTQYTISSDEITIPASLVKANSIIDLEFRDVDATNDVSVYSVPDVHEHNATNKQLLEFTQSETFEHWNDMIYKSPNLTGQSFGINNYHKDVKLHNTGGTIMMYDDISIMHDYTYANTDLDIRDALSKQARDFVGFRERFKAQVLRLYKAKSYTATKHIVRDALRAITEIKKGTELYKNSNMVYFTDNRETKFELTTSQTVIYPNDPINTDFNIMDHAYVYLSENNGSNQYYERLLVKDVDYTTTGSKITLTQTATAVGVNDPAFITLQFVDRENPSYVPESMVKLGLAFGTPPTVEADLITLHDGDEISYDNSNNLYDPTTSNYDVVNACLLDLDKRIWAGIRSGNMDSASPVTLLPGIHYDTWYTKQKLDNYTEQLYRDFAAKQGYEVYNLSTYYQAGDSTTWNYSSMGSTIGTDIPGHWKGAYQYLFGTHRPDLTPWHMLGNTSKPDWWDSVYSWTDTTPGGKRERLINALTNGHTSNVVDHVNYTKTEVRYARWNWDWANKCPVDTSGQLVPREDVLGTPSEPNRSQDFVFGDYGPFEITWRRTALGQSALLDAIVKLLPAKAWTEFFQPGLYNEGHLFSSNRLVNKFTKESITPNAILYNNNAKYQKIKRIKVKSSTTGWAKNTVMGLFSPDKTRPGKAIVDVDNTGTIKTITLTDGTFAYQDTPIFTITNDSNGALYNQDALVDIEFIMGDAIFDGNGLNKVLDNNLTRNTVHTIMKDIYIPIDTKLVQKVGGFTSENLVDFYTESGAKGKYKVDTNDYNVFLYKGPPRKLCNASVIKLKNTMAGTQVDGLGLGKQKFYFYEPLRKSDNFVDVELVSNAVVRRYTDYDYSSVSSIEYGATIGKIQDLYNFVRGYYEYLRRNGVNVKSNGTTQATNAAIFAVDSQLGDETILTIGDEIRYTGTMGRLAEFGTLPGGVNSILDERGKIIPNKEYTVDRIGKDAIIKINTAKAIEFGSVTVAEIDFEHVVEFDNTTQFNDTLFNDITNQRHHRLLMKGHRTLDWDGNKKAPGYLVFENKIVENFDTSVETINTLYDYNVENVNPTFRKAQDITIGNYNKDWVNDTFINDQTFGKFYQGLIKAKGTSNVMKPFNRSSMLNDGQSEARIYEEWMFRHSYYGENTNVNATEIRLSPDPSNPTLVDNNVEILDITDDDIQYVNGTNAIRFNTETMQVFDEREYKLKTAGEVIDEEENSGNIVKTLQDMKSIYDSTKEYATIPTWSATTSYKRGDKVRYKGRLLQCAVPYIEYNTQATTNVQTGTVSSPTFEYRTSGTPNAIIDGTPVFFNETRTVFAAVSATATANPQIASGSRITIADGDGSYNEELTIVNLVRAPVVQSNASFVCITSGATDPIIADNTGKNVVINGFTIPLFNATYPAGSPLTRANIANIINSNTFDSDIDATYDSSTQNITIEVQANGNPNRDLVLGAGTANGDLSIIPGTYSPYAPVSDTFPAMDATTLVSKLNQAILNNANVNDITASVVGGFVVITKQPTSGNTSNSSLILSGFITEELFGLASGGSTTVNMTSSNVAIDPQRAVDAVASIQAAAIPGISVSVNSNEQIVISSSNTSFNLDDATNDFNDNAGLPGGIQTAPTTIVDNVFTASDWTDISDSDPALFRIQVVQDDNPDNADGVILPANVTTVFNGYNLFQVQNLGFYSEVADEVTGDITSECSICAGTATEDGNDACVNTNVNHNLEVGDYVMIVNSTSTPSVDGIHKITSLGTVNEPRKFYIDMFIEECGDAPQVYVLRPCRFRSDAQVTTANSSNKQIQESLANIGAAIDGVANTPQYVIGSGGNASGLYNWKAGDIALSDGPPNPIGDDRGTYVYKHDGTNFVYQPNRSVTSRAVGKDTISHAIIYDGSKNGRQTELELEVFDPVLGSIPGIANMQIDFRAFVDAAGYTHSTDINEPIVLNTSTAWGEAELGKVWWDLSNAIYYDYNQGTAEYKRDYYGKLWEGGSIDVYEWTKSTVTPDEYEQIQVNQVLTKVDITNTPTIGSTLEFSDTPSNVEMFGTKASGTPYSRIDRNSGEKIYYYTEGEDFNSTTGVYDKVYYFWVKDKTTYRPSPNRTMPVKNIAEVIKDPTASGISWIAPISDTEVLLANTQYVTDHKSVLQINKELAKPSHNSWTVLQEGRGLIPEYWYRGTLDNLTGFQASSGIEFPNADLHVYNRFGDDRDLGQGWFYNTNLARREALACVNKHLVNINLVQDLQDKWDRTIGGDKDFIDINVEFTNLPDWEPNTAYNVGDRVKFNNKIYSAKVAHTSGSSSYTAFINNQTWLRYASIYDLTSMWDYADYIAPHRLTNEMPTQQLSSKIELASVDTAKHKIVSVSIQDTDGYDRTEILKWDGTDWVLQEKKNATIQFNNWLVDSNRIDAWDKNNWDSLAWDGNKQVYWYYLVYALRHDMFIERHIDNFNKFFFCMVRHCLATQKQVDWVHKTTYIQLEVTTPASSTTNKYRKGNINSLLGYINDVKPYHTKIRNIIDQNTIDEEANIGIAETFQSDTTIKLNQHSVQTSNNIHALVYTDNGPTTLQMKNGEFARDISVTTPLPMTSNNYGKNDILTSEFGTTTFTDDYTSQAFTDTSTPADTVSGGDFIQPGLHNYTGIDNRNSLAQLDTAEDLTITVITNNVAPTDPAFDATQRRTFVYRQDGKLNALIDVLEQSSSTTTTADITNIDTTIPVTSSANFNKSGGFAYINGEVLEYGTADNNTITVLNRGYASQKAHDSGSTIVDITDASVWNGTIKGVTNSSNEYVDDNKINDIAYNSGTSEWEATSILSGTGRLSARLQSGTQGIDL